MSIPAIGSRNGAKINGKRNTFEQAAGPTADQYADHASGTAFGLLCAVSTVELGEQAQTALQNTAVALGYGNRALTFVTLGTQAAMLEPPAVMQVLEAFDPIALIATDSIAADCLSHAYKCEVPTQASCRVLGRTCVAFRDFEEMLATSQSKQQAWALLKQLPRWDSIH